MRSLPYASSVSVLRVLGLPTLLAAVLSPALAGRIERLPTEAAPKRVERLELGGYERHGLLSASERLAGVAAPNDTGPRPGETG